MPKCPGNHNGMDFWPFTEKDDKLIAHGVDIGPSPTIVARRGDIIAVYVKGHKTWGGNYQPQNYEGANFHVFRKVCDEHYQLVIEFPQARPRIKQNENSKIQ